MNHISVIKASGKAFERTGRSVNLNLPVHGFNPDSEDYEADGENDLYRHYKRKTTTDTKEVKAVIHYLNH